MKYLSKPFLLIKYFFRGLVFNRTVTLSLISVYIRTFSLDIRNSTGTLYETLKSLNSVYDYKKYGFKFLKTQEEVQVSDNEKTLFILGSGPSINEITNEEWKHIKKNTSWGFNFWFCNEFVPDIYVAQNVLGSALGPSYNSQLNSLMMSMLEDKKESYKNVKFYVRGDGVNNQTFYNSSFGGFLSQNFNENIYHLPEMPISSKSKINPEYYLKTLKRRGFFDASNLSMPIPKFGSTIGELIPLALVLGFKKIVLCGIDMNGGDHFYDSEEYFKKYPLLKELSNKNRKKIVHEHMDFSSRAYTVKEIISYFNKFAQKEFDAKVYVIKKSSTLYPDLEEY